ncbi:MAG: single-stranded DNA-binding protein [Actinomycetota bacterium]|nr:single-stranded DNA-binding protein [Actinomycetota bacterium]
MTPTTNHVAVAGRVSNQAEIRTLPSGDTLASFRLIVDRPPAARKRSKQTVDTFECVAWTSRLRTAVTKLSPGDTIEATGQLRRRFSRPNGIPASWVTIELETCRKAEAAA